ncbi:GlxA family transcriptional regulator [Ruegeria pomeroyi]|uniref:GlxA family transcriptional regulator n=1 Tax=Ruegeria alba TaxID=2916756 RepID=A0ABS9NY44_9RHOB|nr:GlxA family transcriptional regulator [Ruegeria alba]MCE8513901.1 GlxA family transcriptional regulator [Ruegeria pomeroyi]MCE8522673.1 GlxA family transcriptional regulator [Ruegeria pomeroyi]MCE8527029.1 GlxA family transcriptional regulator [Ruegeria pomeroyi]MCE8530438.1 GlxA family transcriptional regulator [Ruegeria pomeroyi]MCE8533253.1 GlxA family transcriptional regulator [Ruegeria pomeroyi]
MQLDLLPPQDRGQLHSVFVVVPRFNLTTLITMIETMRIGNYLSSERLFSWEVTSFDGLKLGASNGVRVHLDVEPDQTAPADQVFVLASWGGEHYQNKALASWLRKRARRGERICAVELGCYLVARAGLMDGKEATTHWSWINGFQEKFDQISVVEQLFTIDGRILTCAGGMAGVDLMLRLIEQSHGASFSGEIADQMLHNPIRKGSSSQRRTMGRGTESILPLVRQAMTLIERNIEEPLTVPQIAAALDVSQRQLERQFKKHVGCTVVQFGLLRRLQNARVLLIATELSVREIATASGFNTLSHFSYSFSKFFGRRPSEYREAWPSNETAPTWPGTLSDFLHALNSGDKRSKAPLAPPEGR